MARRQNQPAVKIASTDLKRNKRIVMLKRILSSAALCLLLLFPVAGWTLDGPENWRQLSPREKENVQRNYQRWQSLPPKDKEYLREEWNHWQTLPQDQRDRLRQRYDQLRKLSPEEQRQLRDRFNEKRSRRFDDRHD